MHCVFVYFQLEFNVFELVCTDMYVMNVFTINPL